MELNIAFANLYQLFTFAGKNPADQIFSSFYPGKYIEIFKGLNLDLFSTAEMLFDNEECMSTFVERFAKELALPYHYSTINEKSWVFEGKYYGMTIFSKYPIVESSNFKLPNPNLEVVRPNGDLWKTHDKFAQKVKIDFQGKIINISNLHYFPLHHFKRSIAEPEFSDIKKALVEILKGNSGESTIVTGDFNNKGILLDQAFPELLENNILREAIKVDTTIYGGSDQLDHVLVSDDVTVKEALRFDIPSDHYALFAKLDLVN